MERQKELQSSGTCNCACWQLTYLHVVGQNIWVMRDFFAQALVELLYNGVQALAVLRHRLQHGGFDRAWGAPPAAGLICSSFTAVHALSIPSFAGA